MAAGRITYEPQLVGALRRRRHVLTQMSGSAIAWHASKRKLMRGP
jgi:hypothetical protein